MDKTKSYLILGANGLIGRAIRKQLEGKYLWYGTYNKRKEPELIEVDITSNNDLKRIFEISNPDCVINCANLAGGVNFCENNPELARKFHFDANVKVGELGNKYNARMVLISTDYVFDGKNPPYKEDDPKNPLNVYGKMKLQAERWMEEHLTQYTIVRTTNVFGWDPLTKTPNFIMGLYKKLNEGKTVKAPSCLWGNPTYVDDLSMAVIELIEKGVNGVFNIVGSSYINRYNWALKLCDVIGIDRRYVVEDKGLIQNSVPRPLKSHLSTGKFRKVCKTQLHTVEEGLEMFVDEMNNE
jgi:dTDP-4-dehydrorhamnose reductase